MSDYLFVLRDANVNHTEVSTHFYAYSTPLRYRSRTVDYERNILNNLISLVMEYLPRTILVAKERLRTPFQDSCPGEHSMLDASEFFELVFRLDESWEGKYFTDFLVEWSLLHPSRSRDDGTYRNLLHPLHAFESSNEYIQLLHMYDYVIPKEVLKEKLNEYASRTWGQSPITHMVFTKFMSLDELEITKLYLSCPENV